jgi:predicted  nucleic acid-binding Zn ribbon protein
MILVEIHFGKSHVLEKSELEDIAESYIASLFHAGQLCGEYFLTWINGELTCQTLMSGLGADKLRYHSHWAKPKLREVEKTFGRKPVWKIRDDDVPRRNISWNAPTLHLFTHAFDWKSPLCRGDTGEAVPVFLLPVDFQQKNDLVRWHAEYVLHDRLWLNSGSLEIPAYKELVDPNSELSTTGRELCAAIEKATGVPTYYFLMRYSAPEQGSDSRPCPGCGKAWSCPQLSAAPFHHWPFRCEYCRLVSTVGVDINRRHAKIGQWNPSPKKR